MPDCLVEVEDVGKFYRKVRAVDGVSFSVNSGEIFALLGPNGAGKSTLVRMLIGLIPPDQGAIRWHMDDKKSERIDTKQIDPKQIGYLPEDRGLYQDQKVQAILEYFGKLRGMTTKDARAAAVRWAGRLEFDQYLNAKLETLSKGNQQKVQVAASVLHQPRMVILDEPFSGLDPLNQEKMIDVIRLIRDEGSTVLLSAHQLELVERLADRVLLMSRGRRVIQGTVPELKQGEYGGYQLKIEFAHPVSAELISGWSDDPSVAQLQWRGPQELYLTLKNHGNAAVWLQRAADIEQLVGFSSGSLSLHQIYVRAIGGQSANLNEGKEVSS